MQYKRLLSYLGDKNAPGMLRITLPYLMINQYDPDVLAVADFVVNPNTTYYSELKTVQFQRSCTEGQFRAIEFVKEKVSPKTGTKIFYEVDDLILDLPKFNIAYDYYVKYKDSIKKILSLVDCIVCSTHELAKHMKKYNKTVVIKNRLIKQFWIDKKPKEERSKPVIIWAGSVNHFSKDDHLGDFAPKIIEYIQKTKEIYDWTFVGAIPNQLKNDKDIKYYRWRKNYLEYIQLLKEINPDIGIALLEENDFNKCKSNIKALEYVSLGIPGVYSKITPYHGMSINISTSDQFIDQMEKLINDSEYYNKIKMQDFNQLQDSLYWDDSYIQQYLKIYLGDS